MKVDINDVKRLKQLTGVGITDAKKALEKAKGDFDSALEVMRVKGLAKADKRSQREARSGLVDSYVHSSRIGVVIEVNCETDFVAKTDDFQQFVHNLAMHIAASAPLYIARSDVPEAEVEKEQSLIRQELAADKKPPEVIEKIVEGKLEKFYESICLLEQAYVKNPDQKVEEYIKELIAKLGENIVVRQFERIELGGN